MSDVPWPLRATLERLVATMRKDDLTIAWAKARDPQSGQILGLILLAVGADEVDRIELLFQSQAPTTAGPWIEVDRFEGDDPERP